MYIEIGSSWAHVTLLRAHRGPQGAHPRQYVFRCDCGHEFEREAASFRGRKSLRDCGRPECEYAQARALSQVRRPNGRPRNRETCAALTLYLPIACIAHISQQSQIQGVSISAAAAHLIERGMGAAA